VASVVGSIVVVAGSRHRPMKNIRRRFSALPRQLKHRSVQEGNRPRVEETNALLPLTWLDSSSSLVLLDGRFM
jgi:hypothetical protein